MTEAKKTVEKSPWDFEEIKSTCKFCGDEVSGKMYKDHKIGWICKSCAEEFYS